MLAYTHYSIRTTPQSEPIPGSDQVANHAGGYGWQLDDWQRLERFLVLGSEGGTYYVSEQTLTVENAEVVRRCIQADGKRTVARIVEISDAGRAPKNDPALFALAMCAGLGDQETRRFALQELPKVARISTHLFHFLQFVRQFRGFGRGLRHAIARWYNERAVEPLAYQVVKYRQRDGWTHADALRLAHPKNAERNWIYKWIVDQELPEAMPAGDAERAYRMIWAYEEAQRTVPLVWVAEHAQKTVDPKALVTLITEYHLPWEALPTEALKLPEIWEALIASGLPLTAMLRSLGRMTACGALKQMGASTARVIEAVTNAEALKRQRVHPLSVLVALSTYSKGRGDRGSLVWSPIPALVDALDKAFYLSFGAVEPCGKRLVLALDVSGSMGSGGIAGLPSITPRVASAAMALITANVESQYAMVAFSHEMVPVSISPRQRLDDVVDQLSAIPMGGTDCALPMLWALEQKIQADAFIIYTDSETWANKKMHPAQALRKYREQTGIAAKLIVVGMTATEITIADSHDAGMLDVVGFDAATPNVMSDFIRE